MNKTPCLKLIKNPIFIKSPKFSNMQKSLENACKHVKRWKMKVKMVLPSIDEENLWSFDHENDQKKKKKEEEKDEGSREESKW